MNNREIALAAAMAGSAGGGGGGGTTDYEQLTNKPQINGNQLIGNKSSADLGIVETWVGTAAEFAQQAASIPAGTPYIITDDDVAPCYFDSTTGEFYVNGVKILAVMTGAAYEALTTKSNIWYATYATPSNSRIVENTPLSKNENSEGEPETEPVDDEMR